ncbi:hypothetical protein K450DRAFT_263242 [Umbelopsis ramanniana AG]|uniref:C2H2-type domain-containing protein n=1 Tax=Umbelopsis ramanniana AG TaxID=1314678 RepID=A0AAD5E1C8_UMBRA|nr:uncharacterized protein K450DRAFT_263242 [Umbelopsis ramanniana AG]KAI8575119.1 hypothetical protein K450DRAFT_263242 [Umbelopsis ramanniana AG]
MNVTRQRGKPPQDPDWQFISSEADSENKFPRRYGCSGCYKSFESRDTLSTHVEALHTELTLAESAQVKQSSRRNNEALQSPSISDGLDQASDVRLKKRKGYESPTGGESTRRHRNLLEEFTTSLEENPFDDDDDPLISVPTDFGFEFKRESEEEWILNGEDVLESIYEYQNASLRYLRQKTAINENMERILSLSSIILLRDQSTVFDDSSDQLQLREAIKLEQLSAMQTEMNEDEKFDLESLRNILKMTLKENNRTLGLKAIDATEMKELSRLKELTRYIIGHHPFRKVSHVGRKSETETQCTTAHLYPFMLSMYGDPDRFPVVFGNSSSTASAARINGKYQARQPDGIIQAVHGHATFEAGYMENKFNNATKANVAKDLMRLCRFAKDSLDLLRRRSVNPDLFVTLNQIVDHHVDLFVSKRKADGFTLVTQVGSYELPCTIRDMLAFLDDYEGLHMFFKASLDCCAKFRQVLVTNPPTLADTTYRQCVSTPELKKFLLL